MRKVMIGIIAILSIVTILSLVKVDKIKEITFDVWTGETLLVSYNGRYNLTIDGSHFQICDNAGNVMLRSMFMTPPDFEMERSILEDVDSDTPVDVIEISDTALIFEMINGGEMNILIKVSGKTGVFMWSTEPKDTVLEIYNDLSFAIAK